MTRSSIPKEKQNGDTEKPLHIRIERLRLERDLTYDRLASLIGGVTGETVRRAARGERLNARTTFKLKRFLEGVNVNA